MKKILSLVILVFLFAQISAQDGFTVPQVSQQEKEQILYNHVIAYAVTGISFAKSKGVSAEEYGRYIGKLFAPMWNPDDGFGALASGMMYILAGMHPNNEMTIIDQNKNMVKFKMKNVTMAFGQGPFLGVTEKEFLDCSYGVIDELAKRMNAEFKHKMGEDGWYEVMLKAK